MTEPIRGEMWSMAFALESTYGSDPGTARYVLVPGILQNATMPDPATEFNPFWMLGENSYRNWYVAYKGRRTLQGSLPEMPLLNGVPLYLPIGTCATIGGVVDGSGLTFIACSRGDTGVPTIATTEYTSGDYIQVGSGSTAEVRRVNLATTSGTVPVTQPLRFNHGSGTKIYSVSSPYTHAVTEAVNLDSVAMHITNFNTEQTSQLMRRFLGGKIGRASIACREGEYLTMSFDDMSFTKFENDQSGEDGYAAGVGAITPVYPTTQPYLFSYGSLTLNGTVFARVRAFRLEVNNQLMPKYYVSMSGQAQLPYEYREGQRQYRLSVDIDIEDSSLYKEVLRQGAYSSIYKGFQSIFVMTRGTNDTITITTPPSTPAAGGNAMGCLIQSGRHDIQSSEPLTHVPLDILCRSIGISVVDSVAYLPE